MKNPSNFLLTLCKGKQVKILIATFLPTSLFLMSTLASVFISIFFVALAVIFLSDTFARFWEYLKLKEKLKHETDCRYLRLMRGSRCERLVAIAVSPDRSKARAYYRSLGYKWYHLFPDGTFSKQSPFLKIRFYLNVVGIKTKRRKEVK